MPPALWLQGEHERKCIFLGAFIFEGLNGETEGGGLLATVAGIRI